MPDRFYRNLLVWGSLGLLFVYLGGRIAIDILNPPPLQLATERMLLSTTMLAIGFAFAGIVIVLFLIEAVRRSRNR